MHSVVAQDSIKIRLARLRLAHVKNKTFLENCVMLKSLRRFEFKIQYGCGGTYNTYTESGVDKDMAAKKLMRRIGAYRVIIGLIESREI